MKRTKIATEKYKLNRNDKDKFGDLESNRIEFLKREQVGRLKLLSIEDHPPNRKRNKPTGCEKAMAALLHSLHIEYEREFPLFFVSSWKVYDFRIGDDILIEVDGDFYHANPDVVKDILWLHDKTMKNDWQKDWIARNSGFRLLRFWEHEVLENSDDVAQRVLEAVHKS